MSLFVGEGARPLQDGSIGLSGVAGLGQACGNSVVATSPATSGNGASGMGGKNDGHFLRGS